MNDEEDYGTHAIRRAYVEAMRDAAGEPVARKDVIASIAASLEGNLASSEVWFGYVTKVVEDIDARLRASLHNDLQGLLDAINGDTILGADDPRLDMPIPTGTRGERISLRYASRRVLVALITERTEHAKDAAIAANRFAHNVNELVQVMDDRGVAFIGQLTE